MGLSPYLTQTKSTLALLRGEMNIKIRRIKAVNKTGLPTQGEKTRRWFSILTHAVNGCTYVYVRATRDAKTPAQADIKSPQTKESPHAPP